MEIYKTHEVTVKLKRDLKLKRRPTASDVMSYAPGCGAKLFVNFGNETYHWSEDSYKQLIKVFEE